MSDTNATDTPPVVSEDSHIPPVSGAPASPEVMEQLRELQSKDTGERPVVSTPQPVDDAAARAAVAAAGGDPTQDVEVHELQLTDSVRVKIREPKGSTMFRAAKIVPSELANHQIIMSSASAMLYVIEINGVAKAPPQTFEQVESMVDLIGDDGITVLQMELGRLYPMSGHSKARMQELQNLSKTPLSGQ